MISQIQSHDPFLQVSSSSTPYVGPNYGSGLNVGQVRFNTSSQSLEAYDGNNWVMISSPSMSASINLSSRAQAILVHAEKQMMQDQKFAAMAEKHPAIADALETFREAAEKLQVVVALCEE